MHNSLGLVFNARKVDFYKIGENKPWNRFKNWPSERDCGQAICKGRNQNGDRHGVLNRLQRAVLEGKIYLD